MESNKTASSPASILKGEGEKGGLENSAPKNRQQISIKQSVKVIKCK